MSIPSLTQGAIQRMCASEGSQGSSFKPVLQVLDIKLLQAKGPSRYRLILSDGEYYHQGMLLSQANDHVESGSLTNNAIIRVEEFVMNVVANRKVIIVMNLEKIHDGTESRIGKPINFEPKQGAAGAGDAAAAPPAVKSEHRPAAAGGGVKPPQTASRPIVGTSSSSSSSSSSSAYGKMGGSKPAGGPIKYDSKSRDYHPISSLNPYNNRWTIKARVTSKSDFRTWTNARGAGKLFTVDLLDAEGGQIRATMFNSAADKFFPLLQENKVYTVSRGQLKLANKKYSRLPSEYELTLNDDAEIELLEEDDASIGLHKFAFVKIVDVTGKEPDEFIDVIGIVKEVGPLSRIVSAKTSKELVKRPLQLVDDSLSQIELTLWGSAAERYNEQELADFPVLAVKNARVSNYGGRCLGTAVNSQIFVNLDHPDFHHMRGWYDQQGHSADMQQLSNNRMGAGGAGGGGMPRKSFADVKEQNLGADKADYFLARATITYFKADAEKAPWYLSCPECKKKVIQEESTGGYRCDKCGKNMATCQPRYILPLQACDHSGSLWLTAFDAEAETLVGRSATEMLQLKEEPAAFTRTFSDANFQPFHLKVRAKMEQGLQDEPRIKYQIVSVNKLDFRTESQFLLGEIAKFA